MQHAKPTPSVLCGLVRQKAWLQADDHQVTDFQPPSAEEDADANAEDADCLEGGPGNALSHADTSKSVNVIGTMKFHISLNRTVSTSLYAQIGTNSKLNECCMLYLVLITTPGSCPMERCAK
eukprot:jgi/Ulvmu1/5180/UM021_0197.1